MNDLNSNAAELDRAEQEILAHDVSDETLETAFANRKERVGGYTASFCTGLSTCPG
jgi:hypothetical protein